MTERPVTFVVTACLAFMLGCARGPSTEATGPLAGLTASDAETVYTLVAERAHTLVWQTRGWEPEELVLDISSATPDLPPQVLQAAAASPLVRQVCGPSAACAYGREVMVGVFSLPDAREDGSYAIDFTVRGDDSLRRPGDHTGFGATWRFVVQRGAAWEIRDAQMLEIT